MLTGIDDLRLRELVLLDRVVQLGTITQAAAELGIPKATASRWLALLEAHVGHSLLRRGARSVELNERGKALYAQVPRMLAASRALQAAASPDRAGGTLRVSVPVPLGRLVGGSVIASFRRRMPQVRLEVLLANEHADLVRDRVDVAIRGGPMADSDLVAARLTTVGLWLYTGPQFRELPAFEAPLVAAPGDEERLRRVTGQAFRASVVVDDRTAVRDALLAGAGVGVLPGPLGEPYIESGSLSRAMPSSIARVAVHAVFLPEQRSDPRVRALIEIVRGELGRWQD